jgi:hypothetical protein
MQYIYDLFSEAELSEESRARFVLPIKRADTGEYTPLGNFLVSLTAAKMANDRNIPSVAILSWGINNIGEEAFSTLQKKLSHMNKFGADWKVEGFARKISNDTIACWFSCFPIFYENEDVSDIYTELGIGFAFERYKNALDFWQMHFIDPVAKNDPKTYLVVAFSKDENLAKVLVADIKGLILGD